VRIIFPCLVLSPQRAEGPFGDQDRTVHPSFLICGRSSLQRVSRSTPREDPFWGGPERSPPPPRFFSKRQFSLGSTLSFVAYSSRRRSSRVRDSDRIHCFPRRSLVTLEVTSPSGNFELIAPFFIWTTTFGFRLRRICSPFLLLLTDGSCSEPRALSYPSLRPLEASSRRRDPPPRSSIPRINFGRKKLLLEI